MILIGSNGDRLKSKSINLVKENITEILSLMTDNPYNLNRFIEAQQKIYGQALSEIKNGKKQSHWMWYIFPQFTGLGYSKTSQDYAIKSLEEARAYLGHPLLGKRLHQCVEAVLSLEGRSAWDIFGSPDDMKLRSCATLFAHISPVDSIFSHLLKQYFNSESDPKTLHLLKLAGDRHNFS